MPIIGNKTNEALASTKVKVKTTTTAVVAANLNRNGLEIVNESANSIYLQLGKAAVAEEGLFLAASGGSWNGMVGPMVWTGSVFGLAATAESNVTVAEV
jgi:hypothetical protein